MRDLNRATAEDEEDEIPLNENNTEVRKNIVNLKTQASKCHGLRAERFSRFSSLHSSAIANLIAVIKELKHRKNKSQEKIESKISSSENTLLTWHPTAKEL